MGVDSYKALHRFYRLLGNSHSSHGLKSEADDINHILACYDEAVSVTEKKMWDVSVPEWIDLYHHLYREKEAWLKIQGVDERHHINVVIPVADRPVHLQTCLHSLMKLCSAFHYGGVSGNYYEKVSVIIADDSREQINRERHQQLARDFTQQGLHTSYFGITEQLQQLDTLNTSERESIVSILGTKDRSSYYHKGPSVMRNIACLKLNELQAPRQLFYFVDSDQEFRVKIQSGQGKQDWYAINYFAELDRVFSEQKVHLLTGKVVGDPPVSPAVMAGNFLEDVIAFLHELSGKSASDACRFHGSVQQNKGEAAYHDMAGLFGFEPSQEPYPYRCDVAGEHDHLECLQVFAQKLNQFFFGEHPTRKSFYEYAGAELDIKPARTVYTGNYVFNAAGLKYFIPFAALRLRMAGPVLGRVIRAEIGDAFVSANLPMLHKRTVEQTGQSEFRPGVIQDQYRVDLSSEFERQYYGDVMLFSMQKLTRDEYPESLLNSAHVEEVVKSTERTINRQYMTKHEQIMRKIELLKTLFNDADNWWNQPSGLEDVKQCFDYFMHNMEHNYAPDSQAHRLVNSARNRSLRIEDIVNAIHAYPADRSAWEAMLSRHQYKVQR